MKIYTKNGDRGQTHLVDGMKVDKDDIRIEVIGELDELNSHLGLLASNLNNSHENEVVEELQQTIFLISGNISNQHISLDSYVTFIEKEIDNIQSILSSQNAFLLPGGHAAAAQAHVCRCVCRRVERRVYTLSKNCPINDGVLKYLNRMSDFLYVLARKINFENGIHEKIWQNTCR
ncbi:MAG: cob(I)yrinic acid a,c-diamide adenosyltransferase [Prevotella sp.]|nr:cob(I)yrinic acid a,c-diamide adenosyltransferase [Prevotella sp.]MBR5062368.1 cob(I)yrinic acid a,c-diamide adenosyltransferase [Prevotella sp.]